MSALIDIECGAGSLRGDWLEEHGGVLGTHTRPWGDYRTLEFVRAWTALPQGNKT